MGVDGVWWRESGVCSMGYGGLLACGFLSSFCTWASCPVDAVSVELIGLVAVCFASTVQVEMHKL